jgi:hypothetical protein
MINWRPDNESSKPRHIRGGTAVND